MKNNETSHPTQSGLTGEGGNTERTKDEAQRKAVEKLLDNITNTAKYYKAIAGDDVNFDINLDSLSEEEQTLLLGPNYLDTSEEDKEFVRWADSYYYPTTIPYLFFKRESYTKKAGEDAITLEVRRTYGEPFNRVRTRPFSDQTDSFIKEIVARVDNREQILEMRKAEVEGMIDRVRSELTKLNLQESIEYPPTALKAFVDLNAFLRIIDQGRLDEEWATSILRRLDELSKREETEALPFVGLEVEVPYTGSALRNWVKPASYIAFREYLDLFPALSVPTEEDKQGEVSLPKSKNAALQLEILNLIHKMGYLPWGADKSSPLRYTLHVNIGIPTELEDVLYAQENGQWTQALNPHESSTPFILREAAKLSSLLGLIYSSAERLGSNAYYWPVNFKGVDNPEERRLEIRNLEFNPQNDNETMLKDVRLAAYGFMLAFSEKGDSSVREAYQEMMEKIYSDISLKQGVLNLEAKLKTGDFAAAKLKEDAQLMGSLKSDLARFIKVVEAHTTEFL